METIQKRVTDAYYSRSQRGFKMGGKAPYGFHTEPIKMDGINTKKLVVNPEEAANIRLMFEMYADPATSYGDITRYFAEQGILFYGKELIRPTLAQMLRNPVYVQADLDVYEFFKSQGTVLVNDAADFTGMNGCYLYQGRDVKPDKLHNLKDQMLVLAPVQFRYLHVHIGEQDVVCPCQAVHQLFNLAVHMSKFHLQGGNFRIGLCRFLPARQRLVAFQLFYHLLINYRFQFSGINLAAPDTAFIIQPFCAAEVLLLCRIVNTHKSITAIPALDFPRQPCICLLYTSRCV